MLRNPLQAYSEKDYTGLKVSIKYQLRLRTSNLPGLVITGKMLANEGGANTHKFIYIASVAEMDQRLREEQEEIGSIPIAGTSFMGEYCLIGNGNYSVLRMITAKIILLVQIQFPPPKFLVGLNTQDKVFRSG